MRDWVFLTIMGSLLLGFFLYAHWTGNQRREIGRYINTEIEQLSEVNRSLGDRIIVLEQEVDRINAQLKYGLEEE